MSVGAPTALEASTRAGTAAAQRLVDQQVGQLRCGERGCGGDREHGPARTALSTARAAAQASTARRPATSWPQSQASRVYPAATVPAVAVRPKPTGTSPKREVSQFAVTTPPAKASVAVTAVPVCRWAGARRGGAEEVWLWIPAG